MGGSSTDGRISCGRADSVMDLHTAEMVWYFSTELLTDYHHISIIKLSVRWCVRKVEEGFPD